MAEDAPSVKICGLKTREAAAAAISAGADFLGLVFYHPSPRNISLEQAQTLGEYIRNLADIPIVAVTVNPDDKLLDGLVRKLQPDWLQLHGSESPQRTAEIRNRCSIPVIKAFSVCNHDDIAAAEPYNAVADALLFDAKAPDNRADSLPGGNGLQFDWSLLAGRDFPLPWFLSGGLDAQNVRQAMRISGAKRVDVSSGVETAPGEKSRKLIEQFITAAKNDGGTAETRAN